MYDFRWNESNVDHIAEHGIDRLDAEYVANHARQPYPKRIEDEKFLVWGQTRSGQYLQVIYIVDPDRTLYIIHSRPLSEREKHQFKRRRR